MTIKIKTRLGMRQTSLAKAIRSLSRAPSRSAIRSMFTCERGSKARILAMAERAYSYRQSSRSIPSLQDRLRARLLSVSRREISARRLSTPAGWSDFAVKIADWTTDPYLWLVHGEGWYDYGGMISYRHRSAAYLCGKDDGQYFAVRVTSTCTTIESAIRFLTPRPVRLASEQGLPVRRQGDIFFRPMRIAEHDMSALRGTRHSSRTRRLGGLTIVHPQHKPLILSGKYKWRAYQSTQVHGVGAD